MFTGALCVERLLRCAKAARRDGTAFQRVSGVLSGQHRGAHLSGCINRQTRRPAHDRRAPSRPYAPAVTNAALRARFLPGVFFCASRRQIPNSVQIPFLSTEKYPKTGRGHRYVRDGAYRTGVTSLNLRLHHKTTCLPVPFRRVPSPPLCAGCYKCRCAPAARCHNSRFVIH